MVGVKVGQQDHLLCAFDAIRGTKATAQNKRQREDRSDNPTQSHSLFHGAAIHDVQPTAGRMPRKTKGFPAI